MQFSHKLKIEKVNANAFIQKRLRLITEEKHQWKLSLKKLKS